LSEALTCLTPIFKIFITNKILYLLRYNKLGVIGKTKMKEQSLASKKEKKKGKVLKLWNSKNYTII